MVAKPAYDLMVLIDADAPEDRRGAVLQSVKGQIASGDGELKGDAEWGVRKLAYEIDHRSEAYYHLFQLEAEPDLLRQLEHSLSIEDAVLRHRIIRLPKGAPETTPRAPAPPVFREGEGRHGEGRGEHRGRGADAPEPEPEAPQAEAQQGDEAEQGGEEAPAPQPASS